MICKERNSLEHPETDKFSKAGANAEKQMAFYLKRAFSDSKDIRVFHDLRFKDEDNDCAQIDHLILHKHGFIIIESKSVTTKVAVNQQGEWVRYWNNKPEGMPSPVLQAQRQITFLKRSLNEYREELIRKILGLLQARFDRCPFAVVVAISDKGIIQRGKNKLPEVMKADQVVDKIEEIIAREKKRSNPLRINMEILTEYEAAYNFKPEEMENITNWLLEHHYPLKETKPPALPPPSPEEEIEFTPPSVSSASSVEDPGISGAGNTSPDLGICDKCGEQCMIKWGKYSYYWKCEACDNNMSIKLLCPSCNARMKLRKSKDTFYKCCKPCETEELYCEFE